MKLAAVLRREDQLGLQLSELPVDGSHSFGALAGLSRGQPNGKTDEKTWLTPSSQGYSKKI